MLRKKIPPTSTTDVFAFLPPSPLPPCLLLLFLSPHFHASFIWGRERGGEKRRTLFAVATVAARRRPPSAAAQSGFWKHLIPPLSVWCFYEQFCGCGGGMHFPRKSRGRKREVSFLRFFSSLRQIGVTGRNPCSLFSSFFAIVSLGVGCWSLWRGRGEISQLSFATNEQWRDERKRRRRREKNGNSCEV